MFKGFLKYLAVGTDLTVVFFVVVYTFFTMLLGGCETWKPEQECLETGQDNCVPSEEGDQVNGQINGLEPPIAQALPDPTPDMVFAQVLCPGLCKIRARHVSGNGDEVVVKLVTGFDEGEVIELTDHIFAGTLSIPVHERSYIDLVVSGTPRDQTTLRFLQEGFVFMSFSQAGVLYEIPGGNDIDQDPYKRYEVVRQYWVKK